MLQIYITDLAAYNAGCLIGKWVKLPIDKNELNSEIKDILEQGTEFCGGSKDYPNAENFITDYEFENSDIDIFKIDEYDNVSDLNEKMKLIEESVEPFQHKILKFLMDNGFASSLEEAIEKVDDVFVYDNYTMRDIAEEFVDEFINLDGINDLIKNNLDYDGIARDLEMDGVYFEVDGDIYQYYG